MIVELELLIDDNLTILTFRLRFASFRNHKYKSLRIVYHQPKIQRVEYHNLLVMAYVMIQITMMDATLIMEIAVHLIMMAGIGEGKF